jgi:DDE family transposase
MKCPNAIRNSLSAKDMIVEIIFIARIQVLVGDAGYNRFKPIITRMSEILPLSVITADRSYDSEDYHQSVRENLHGLSVIPARYERIPIWRIHGRHRKQMKRGYSKFLYNQRNKDETIMSVIKRLFGEHIKSRLTRTQNRELSFRCITYNMHRLTNLIILMLSTKPLFICMAYNKVNYLRLSKAFLMNYGTS